MPNLGSFGAQQSKYPPLMKAEDLSKPAMYTIAAAEVRQLRGETKVILAFKETDKQLVLNKTNIGAFVERYGDVEPSALVGKQVTLASVPTQYQGKATKGIRVVG